MMKNLLVVSLLILVGCSDERTTKAIVTAVDGINGKDGISGAPGQFCYVTPDEQGSLLTCGNDQVLIKNGVDGQDGSNGESGSDGESCSVREVEGGAIITCSNSCVFIEDGVDGSNGRDGRDGTSSSILITDYNTNSCVKITGTNSYTKPTGSNNYGLYSSSSCHSSSKFAEVSQGEAYWVSSKVLATHTSSSGLRVITFN